ncbi:MAG TPA: hypothetical protein VGM88_19885 [Kofleriaceae bacterium]
MKRLLAALVLVAACYTVPEPACGFRCGTNGECPDHYSCGAMNICVLDDAPADTTCGLDGGTEAP